MSYSLETISGQYERFGFGLGPDINLGELPAMPLVQFAEYAADTLIGAKQYMFEEEITRVIYLIGATERSNRELPIEKYTPGRFSLATPYATNPFEIDEAGIVIGKKYEVSITEFAAFTAYAMKCGAVAQYVPTEVNAQLSRLRLAFS